MSGEYDPGEGRHHFERPETLMNRSMRWMADRRSHAELPQSQIEELRDNSIEVFSEIVADHEALEKVRSETDWYMTGVSCPSMVLSGEVTIDDDHQNPEARFFADAPVLTIKKDAKREAKLLGAADHFTGHLYAYFTGAKDYDEHAAVYWQNRAAVARLEQGDKRFRGTPFLNMIGYRFHKQIPYEVYSSRSLPFMKSLSDQAPKVEVCELRHPEALGWTRLTTQGRSTGIITSYRRSIPSVEQLSFPVHQSGENDEDVWSVDLSLAVGGQSDVLSLTKEGRPFQADLSVVAKFEQLLSENGAPAQPEPSREIGGFPQIAGF